MTKLTVNRLVVWGVAVWLATSLVAIAQQNDTSPRIPPWGLGEINEGSSESSPGSDVWQEETPKPGEIEYAGLLWDIGPVAATQVGRETQPIRDRIHHLEQELERLQRELQQQRMAERQLIEPHFTATHWRKWGQTQRRQISPATKLAFNQQIYATIAQDIEDIGDYQLYRGVPRHNRAEEEANERPTKLHQGYRFYDEPVEIPADQAGRFAAWALDPQNWQLHSDGKFCGGFHPDWCLLYQSGGTSVRVMICFGCHEVWISSADQSVKFDLPPESIAALKTLSGNW